MVRKPAPQNQAQSRPQSVEEEVDDEEEEDQLIDDDEPALSISGPPVASVSAGTKRKALPKKSSRPRKSEKQDTEDKKPDGESCFHALYVLARGTKPTLLIEPREPRDNEDEQAVNAAAVPEKTPKKKAAPRKTPAVSKPRIKVPPKYVVRPSKQVLYLSRVQRSKNSRSPPRGRCHERK